jgi:hypothetical protein
MPPVHEQLSEQFYRWELRGRGWQVHGEPVCPEPPFIPFNDHSLPYRPTTDDGRRPTLFSALYQKLAGPPSAPPVIPEPEEEPEPMSLIRDNLVELQVSLPSDLDISRDAFEQFLLSLSLCHEPVAFELLGTHRKVIAQFATHSNDAPLLSRQLHAFFPEGIFQPQPGALQKAWDSTEGEHVLPVEFGLEREFMFPLTIGKLDAFVGIIGALSELAPEELGLFQVLFQPVRNRWNESILRSVTHEDGKPFFVNMPELVGAAEKKIARPLYAAIVRSLVRTPQFDRTLQIARDMAASLRVFINPQGNALLPLDNEEYPFEEHVNDVICRQSRRSGMLLNIDELMGFVHLPSSDVRSPVLQRQRIKTRTAPGIVQRPDGLLLGKNEYAGETVSVRLSREQRVKHCHIIGTSGTGKSTLLFNLIRQDIESGQGVALLDPHGDLVDRILGIIPPERIEDVVLVDPSDEHFPVAFNILQAHSALERALLASDLVAVFRRLSTSWGDQMDSVLKNAILTFLRSSRGGTLADLRRFLLEDGFQAEFLKSVQDPELVYYWQTGFRKLSGNKSIGSIITRLNDFLVEEPIRNMVSQPVNRLDFAQMMDTGKIFLARLSQGLLNNENAHLLGTLLVSKFQQIAMARQSVDVSQRRPFWIYCDECHNFVTPSMAQILTSTRKYNVGLTLAHQDLQQLKRDPEVASAILSGCFTRIVFHVGDDDAKKLAEGFSHFEASDLRNLEAFQAVVRVERSDYDFNLAVRPFEPLDETRTAVRREEVITCSRRKYGTPRSELERNTVQAKAAITPQEPPAAKSVKAPSLPIQQVTPEAPPVFPSPPAAEVPKPAEIPKAAEPAEFDPVESVDSDDTDGQHLAIKEKIGDEAETLDYSVSYEEDFPPIHARADIVLRRGKQFIIGQVSVTTPAEYEAASVKKFLMASFTHIAVISVSRQKLNLIRKGLIDAGANTKNVGFYSPEEFMSRLSDWAMDDPEGGVAEKKNPHKNPNLNLVSNPLTEEERKTNEKKMLEDLKKKMKRDNESPKN